MISQTRAANNGPDSKDSIGETIHVGFVFVHTVCAAAALGFSIVFLVYALASNCSPDSCQSMLYITSTFLSARRVESNVGWPVTTERTLFRDPTKQYPLIDTTSSTGYGFTHFYECMHSARMADLVCNFPDSFSDYYTCMTNSTPSPLRNALSPCNVFPTVSNYSHYMTSEDYLTCLNWQPVLRNSISSRASRNVFRACLAKSQWPFVEFQLDVDSPTLLGSYNWALFLSVGFAIMTSFAVYSMSWKEDGPVTKGEPSYFMRLGLFWAWIAWLWNLGFFVVFLLVAFRETGNFENNGGVPTTVSTTLVTLGLLALVLVYFGNELFGESQWEFLAHALQGTGYHKIMKHKAYKRFFDKSATPLMDPTGNARGGELGAPMPGASRSYTISDMQVSKYYTPPLLATWADGYIADAVIFLGVAGATQQVTTDQAWNFFVLMGSYRLLNMMIARFLYECFMNNISLEESVNDSKFTIKPVFLTVGHENRHSDPHLSIRVMALSTQISAIYLYIAIAYLSFNPGSPLADFKLFREFVIFGFMIPEAIRILLHVYCHTWYFRSKASSWLLLNTHMFVWNWDIACRLIFLSIIMLNTDNSLQGTREYLQRQSNTLLRDFLVSFAY